MRLRRRDVTKDVVEAAALDLQSGDRPAAGAREIGGAVLMVYPQEGAPAPLAELAQLADAYRWELSGLQVERGRLDEVFREITTGTREAA